MYTQKSICFLLRHREDSQAGLEVQGSYREGFFSRFSLEVQS